MPFFPRTPIWIWAANAGPVRFLYVSVHLSTVPVSVALNVPEAPAFVPSTGGVTWPTVSVALNVAVDAVCIDAPLASEVMARIPTTVTAPNTMMRFIPSLRALVAGATTVPVSSPRNPHAARVIVAVCAGPR
jgi:hypothetical protein